MPFHHPIYHLIKQPITFLQLPIPVPIDHATLKTFTPYPAQHNHPLPPTKPPVPFHPQLHQQQLNPLSISITLKSPILNLPYPPPKPPILSHPPQITIHQLHPLSPPYLTPISQFLAPNKDIPPPDLFTNSQI
ncbi:Glu/Leu/Phe/Val dehydrogenase dimerization domain-containing protein, partial [Staphylococcus epidermidis]|uniref:Glu/Leu/Phe/Val dehydrogenase dimerization domain-containing protein n=1 Tax=Staphylococcus epidermidis TaxID=1282 RepID=UPI0037DA6898